MVHIGVVYVLVIRRKEYGLTDIVSSEGIRYNICKTVFFQAYALRKTLKTTNKTIIIIAFM